jgi:hypothetical protein
MLRTSDWEFDSLRAHQVMEDDAAVLVLRPALKTGFSEMGWGSTPPSSANFYDRRCICQVYS